MSDFAIINQGGLTGIISSNDPTSNYDDRTDLINITNHQNKDQIINNPTGFKCTKDMKGKWLIYKDKI